MIILDIDVLHLIEGAKQARGLTVIIDVFRAFSTACYAVRNGAVGILPVGDIDVAYRLKKENPDFFDPETIWAPEKDFELCLNIGLCDFVLKAERCQKDLLFLKPGR
jgi:hypothetical protein